jgi:hypothetical protein
MELHESADAAHDWKTFLAFARQLLADREGAAEKESADPPGPYDLCGANGWQNVTIEGFLEAAIACLGRIDGIRPNTGVVPGRAMEAICRLPLLRQNL